MEHLSSQKQGDPALNMLQVVCINIAATVSLLVVLKAIGASWLLALIGAWIGGSLLTMAAIFAIYRVALISERNSEKRFAAQINIEETIKAWDADRQLEMSSDASDAVDTEVPRQRMM